MSEAEAKEYVNDKTGIRGAAPDIAGPISETGGIHELQVTRHLPAGRNQNQDLYRSRDRGIHSTHPVVDPLAHSFPQPVIVWRDQTTGLDSGLQRDRRTGVGASGHSCAD